MLIHAVQEEFIKTHTPSSNQISEWKGQDIVDFQEHLAEKVQGRISEKWFYTYIKNKPNKLPRIDILNMLSQYASFSNWADFKHTIAEDAPSSKPIKSQRIGRAALFTMMGIVVSVVIAFLWFRFTNQSVQQTFCLVDKDRMLSIPGSKAEILLIHKNQSPSTALLDSNGCFIIHTKEEKIQFVIQSSYYRNDTITRFRGSLENQKEVIKLKPDDYTLMLDYYSNSRVDDWKKRRKQLHQLIDEQAIIYEVLEGEIGVVMYSKDDFISKLTTPTASLKHIAILETKYNQDKLVKLKFKYNP